MTVFLSVAVAVIITVPFFKAVTNPVALTVAILLSDDIQDKFLLVAVAGKIVATNRVVVPELISVPESVIAETFIVVAAVGFDDEFDATLSDEQDVRIQKTDNKNTLNFIAKINMINKMRLVYNEPRKISFIIISNVDRPHH